MQHMDTLCERQLRGMDNMQQWVPMSSKVRKKSMCNYLFINLFIYLFFGGGMIDFHCQILCSS